VGVEPVARLGGEVVDRDHGRECTDEAAGQGRNSNAPRSA
jgi:hypothetical protein